MTAPVEAAPKRSMSPARRLRIYLACKGRCACGVKVPMENTTIDHRIPLWISHDDSDENLRYICRACDKAKTSGDLHVIAKVKRIRRKADPETRKPARMKSRPFPKGSRPLKSRGFSKRGPHAAYQRGSE